MTPGWRPPTRRSVVLLPRSSVAGKRSTTPAGRVLDGRRPDDVVRIMMRVAVRMSPHEIEVLEGLPSWPGRAAILGADSSGFVHRLVRVHKALLDSHVVVLEGQQHVADQLVPAEFARIVLRFFDPDDDEGADRW
jgi:hypothetical protein